MDIVLLCKSDPVAFRNRVLTRARLEQAKELLGETPNRTTWSRFVESAVQHELVLLINSGAFLRQAYGKGVKGKSEGGRKGTN